LEPRNDLHDGEKLFYKADIDAYFEREVWPQVFEAWMDPSNNTLGYEMDVNRYLYTAPRWLDETNADVNKAEDAIWRLLREVPR
jgi:type I restriction enzyme M protein